MPAVDGSHSTPMRSVYLPRLLLVPLVLVLVTACQQRQSDAVIIEAENIDFGALTDEERTRHAERLAPALGVDTPAAGDTRSGPLLIEAVGRPLYSVWLQAGAESDALVVQQVAPGSGTVWQQTLPVGAGLPVVGVDLDDGDLLGEPVLTVTTRSSQPAAATVLLFALTGAGPVLVRATTGAGQLANARLHADHPELPVDAGDLTAAARIDRLAATVHLAAPDQAAVRGQAGVRSHLEQFATGTDTWLAQAAAELLTLPTD